jgi:hypothetical protein
MRVVCVVAVQDRLKVLTRWQVEDRMKVADSGGVEEPHQRLVRVP